MKTIRALIAALFRPAIIFPVPAGIVADSVGRGGLYGLMQNVNNYAESMSSVASSGTNVTLIAAQVLSGFCQINTGASGGFTITMPSTSSIMAALGNTVPQDGSYSEPIHFVNNNVGQTGTLTAGDGNTTIVGTATIATNVTRKYMLRVLNSANLSITNLGAWSL